MAWPYEELQAEVAVQFAILDPDSTPVRCALLYHWRSSCQHAVSSCRLFCDHTVDYLPPAHLTLGMEDHNIQSSRVTNSDCLLMLGWANLRPRRQVLMSSVDFKIPGTL